MTVLQGAAVPDGTAVVTKRILALGAEVLPDGRCRVAVGQSTT